MRQWGRVCELALWENYDMHILCQGRLPVCPGEWMEPFKTHQNMKSITGQPKIRQNRGATQDCSKTSNCHKHETYPLYSPSPKGYAQASTWSTFPQDGKITYRKTFNPLYCRVPAPGEYGLSLCIWVAWGIVENKRVWLWIISIYVSGLVFQAPHLNLTLDYHLET